MGIFDRLTNLAFGKPQGEDEESFDRMMKRGIGYYTANKTFDDLVDSAFETEEENLAGQRSKLEIGLMRRQLGVLDDDEYEDFLNNKKSTYDGLGLLGKGASELNKRMPYPLFMPSRPSQARPILGEGIKHIIGGGGPKYVNSGKLGTAAKLLLRR